MSNWNATASFSWFLYQADIALWKTLEKISKIWGDKSKLEKWSLEVEWEEDFTLYRKEEWKEEIRESYQVKEINKTNPWDYTEAVIKLFQENQKEWERKSFLVTEKKIDINKIDYIKFLDWLYSSRSPNWLTINQDKLKYIKNWINEETTFLSDKIDKNDKYEFNINKETLEKFVKEETEDFFNSGFEYIFWDNKDKVHDTINTLLKLINPNIESEYHFRYLESRIKRFIQDRKNNINLPNIQFTEIVEIINKTGEHVIDEIVTSEFYHDIFINHFIEFFKICIDEDFEDEFIFEYIKSDVWDKYLEFKDNFLVDIWKNTLENNKKLSLFINDTSLKEWIMFLNKTDDNEKKENFKKLLNNASTFIQKDVLKNKIALLVKLYYFKYKWLSLIKDWYFWNELNDKTWFIIWDKKAILTWNQTLYWNGSKSDIKKIIEKNFYYLYEQDFIWIKGSHWNIDWFLDIKNNIEKNKIWHDESEIEEYDVTRIKNIRIFCGNCKVENMDKLLSDECWNDNICKYKD